MKVLNFSLAIAALVFASTASADSLNPVLTNNNCALISTDMNLLANNNLSISVSPEYGTFQGSNDGATYRCRISGSAYFNVGMNPGDSVWANTILTNANCDAIVADINLLSTASIIFSASCEHGSFIGSNDGRSYSSRIHTQVSYY